MQHELRLAAVGTGGIWNTHAKNLQILGGNRVIAVCDLSQENREQAAAQLGTQPHADLGELLEREGVDALICCTPPIARRSVVEAAAARKVPVFVEKPPASSLDDARAIARISAQSGTPVVVGFMYRFLPAVDRLKELVAGRPVNLVQSSFFCPVATEWALPSWFYIKERSGGHVLDQAIHVVDLLRFLAGDITQVHTFGNNVLKPQTPKFTIEDSSSTNLRFASGASGGHVHSWAHSEFTGFVTLIGLDYRLTLHLDARVSGFIGDRSIDETSPAPPEGASHHLEEMRAFLACVRSGDFSTARSPFSDAAKSLATVLAMNESIETDEPTNVQLDF